MDNSSDVRALVKIMSIPYLNRKALYCAVLSLQILAPNYAINYTLEKVKMYTRVPLGDIVSVTKGEFIAL